MTSGMASVVTALPGGEAVEVGITGMEGIPEALHILGPQTADIRCFMQVEGTALRMDFGRFKQQVERNASLRKRVLAYAQYQALVAAQLAACNRLHGVAERLARWLLMTCDRIECPSVDLTQEFLAEMIGARRSTVTLAAGALQKAGIIEYRRGRIRIVDRDGLEDGACECFPIIDRLFDGLYQ